MFGFGMSEGKGSSSFGNILTISIGVGIIVFASMCFKQIPFIGTVFVLPGDSILNAHRVSPALRIVAFLIGGACAIMGVYFQLKGERTEGIKSPDSD